jgi:hypothetical protein
MFEEVYAKYYGKIKQQRRQDILDLMRLAVELNERDWFYELAEQYNALFGRV